MLREAGVELRHAGLERLHLIEQGQDNRPDGGRGSVPVRRRNTQWRRTLAHPASMEQQHWIVKSQRRPWVLGLEGA